MLCIRGFYTYAYICKQQTDYYTHPHTHKPLTAKLSWKFSLHMPYFCGGQ